MKASEMKVGHFYRRLGIGPAEYIGLYAHDKFIVRRVSDGVLYEATLEEYFECDRDGNPIAPEPAVGQVWAYNGEEYVLNMVTNLNGVTLFGLVSHAPCGVGWYVDINKAVNGLTYVRG